MFCARIRECFWLKIPDPRHTTGRRAQRTLTIALLCNKWAMSPPPPPPPSKFPASPHPPQECYGYYTVSKIWNIYFQKLNCVASFPISTFMYLWAIYIFLQWVLGRPIVGIYKSHTDTWQWKLGERPLYFCFRNNEAVGRAEAPNTDFFHYEIGSSFFTFKTSSLANDYGRNQWLQTI